MDDLWPKVPPNSIWTDLKENFSFIHLRMASGTTKLSKGEKKSLLSIKGDTNVEGAPQLNMLRHGQCKDG